MKIELKSLLGLIEEFCRQRCHPCSEDIKHNHDNCHSGCNDLFMRQAIDDYKDHFHKWYINEGGELFVTNNQYYEILKNHKEMWTDYSI